MKDTLHIPLISVVIPVYNGNNYLQDAVNSVFAQTYPNIEIIIVDDGSTDETWPLIEKLGNKVYGFHKENGGIASALNYGIRKAKGNIIAWLSHDDVFFPTKIVKQVEFLNSNPEMIACYTDFDIVDVNLKFISKFHCPSYPKDKLVEALFHQMFINGSTMLIRKECFAKYGYFDETLQNTQDVDYWIRMACESKIGVISESLILSRTHPNQGSRNFEKQLQEEKDTYLKLLLNENVRQNILDNHQKINKPDEVLSLQYEWFGDLIRSEKKWFHYSIQMYDKAISLLNPKLRLRLKKGIANIQQILFGNEDSTQITLRRINYLISESNNQIEAKLLLCKLLKKEPFCLSIYKLLIKTYLQKSILDLRNRQQQN